MDTSQEEKLRCQQLKALARIMAGFTHEQKNHLAIINESNGLLEDILAMQQVTDEILAERLTKIVTTTKTRVARSAEMAKNLNSFAHRMDTPLATFQVNELINEELTLLQRFANMKLVNIETIFSTELTGTYNNPALLQFIFYCLFDTALETSNAKDILKITTDPQGDSSQITLTISGEGDVPFCRIKEQAVYEAFLVAATKMDATFTEKQGEGRQMTFTLRIPSLSNQAPISG